MNTAPSILVMPTRRGALYNGWACLRRGLLILMLLGAALPRLGAEETVVRDLQQEVQIRAELAKDNQLQQLNLIVRVKDRVATLSGAVPSRAVAAKAVETAKKLPEIREVRDQMNVRQLDGIFAPPAQPTPIPPAQTKDKAPPAQTPTPTPNTDKNPAQLTGNWVPVSPDPPGATHGVALLPVIATQTGVAQTDSRAKDADAAGADPPDASAISSAVQNLIAMDARFRRLRFEVKQGKVHLSGIVHQWADLQELARAATRIPGVEGVVLREVKTESAR